MKTHRKTKPARARVMICDAQYGFHVREKRIPIWKPNDPQLPCAVIPTPTAKQARQIVRFFNLTEEEQRERIGVIVQRWMNGYALPAKYPTVADAILAAIGGDK